MGLRSPYKFYEKFCKRTGLRFVNIHSFRHFNASIMILKGVDVKNVQACLGHNDATNDLSKVRPLTTLERARIQTFPASFEFSGSKTDLEQMIGNAVPVDLAKYVAKHLMEYIIAHQLNKAAS